MSGGRLLVIIGAVILVLAIVVIVVMMVNRSRPQPVEEPTPGPEEGGPVVYVPEGTVEIVVAAQNIPRGIRITADNNAVVMASWPENSVPAGTLTTLESAYGRIARLDIPLGMPILETMLTAAPGDLAEVGSDAALLIPRGKVAYALAVAGNASVAWAIQPGDHVDVLISLLLVDLDEDFQSQLPNQASCIGATEGCTAGTLGRLEVLATGDVVNVIPGEAQHPRMITQLTVQNAIVLRVGNWQGEQEATPALEEQPSAEGEQAVQPTPVPRFLPKWVTLAVTAQDALVLKYAEEAGASMDLVLRSAGDETAVATEPVTLQYVFDRFNMQLPPKLPYGTTPPTTQLRQGAAGEVILERGLEIEYSRQHQVTLEGTGASPTPQ
jgi:pilus assembly protein CpaB